MDFDGLCRSLSITRLADITGLDVLGIPVWSAIRPGSRGLSVSNGKGLDDKAARIGALMEAAELELAERPKQLISIVASIADMQGAGRAIVPLERQSRVAPDRVDERRKFGWVCGYVLETGKPIYAPYDLVGLDFTKDSPWNSSAFYMSSVGMGAGFDREAAILHGIEELIEDDTLFGASLLTFRELAIRATKTNSRKCVNAHPSSKLGLLIKTLRERGAKPLFRVLSSRVGLPVVVALLGATEKLPRVNFPCWGAACRETVEKAALAALLEAIQVRLTIISGGRDDLFEDTYSQTNFDFETRLLFPPRIHKNHGEKSEHSMTPLQLATKFKALAIGEIYVFQLGKPRDKVEVVRVLADNMLTHTGFQFKTGGLETLSQLLKARPSR